MKANMGSTDRLIRLIVAVLLVILYFTNVITGLLGIILLVVAFVFLATSLTSICPAYMIFKLNTKKGK